MTTGIEGFYASGRAFLWVEDMFTYALLETLWQDPSIQLECAGARDAVGALVESVPAEFKKRVSGLVDSDFVQTLRSDWGEPDARHLRTPCVEVENLLLRDFGVWSAATKAPVGEIETEAKRIAGTLVWWMACKKVLRKMHGDLTDGFPGDAPTEGSGALTTNASAVDFITKSPFFLGFRKRYVVPWTATQIAVEIQQEGVWYQQDLASGRWVDTFSGKEIFRPLRARFSRAGAVRGLTPAKQDEDFVRLLARRMKSSPPQIFVDLHNVLRRRAGLSAV